MNPTGNPGLATAGTGDVLAGMIAAFLAQRLEPYDAARAAVYVHGLAADRLAGGQGALGLDAGDVAEALPGAMHELTRTRDEIRGAAGSSTRSWTWAERPPSARPPSRP